MAARAPIIAGKSVILLQVQDNIDTALAGVRKKLNKFSASISTIGLDLFRGGIVGSLPLGLIAKDFKEFEDRILFLSTKLETSDAQFAKVTDTIRKLGRETSYTAQEVADGAVQLAQAGFNAQELINTLGPVLDLARGGQIDLGSSAAILANTLRVFNLETSKANEVASQFIVAARKGTLTVLDLKESLKEVVGTLNVLNIDLPTSLALVTQLAQSSLRGTKAGTSLNTALLQLARNQDVLKNSLNISTVDAQGNLLPIIDILDDLLERLEPLGNARRVAVLQRIFNIRGGRAITGLIRDLERTRDLAKDIRAAGDEARKAAQKMDSEFGGAIRFATSAIQDLSIEIGKIVSGPLTEFLRIIPPLANSLQEILRTNPQVVLTIAAIPPAALAAGAGLLTMSYALNKVASGIGFLGGVLGNIGTIINRTLTGQLVIALRTLNAFKKGARGIDRNLSALFLTPQKVARGRNAGKIKPTSFFGRIGSTQLNVGVFARKQLTLLAKLVPTTKTLDIAFIKFTNTLGKFSTAIVKTNPPLKTLITLFTAFGSLIKTLSSPDFEIFAKGSTFLTAIRTIQNQLRFLLKNITTFGTTSLNSFRQATRGFTLYRAAILASAKVGDVLRKLTPNASSLGVSKTAVFLKSLSNYLINTRKTFARGNLAGILNPKPLLILQALFKSTSFAKAGGGIFNAISSGIKGFIAGLKQLTKIDFVRILYNGVTAAKSLTLAFFKLGGVAFRTLTTLSGWGNILTFLTIFGPRIEFIRKGFERLGKGISSAFSTIFGSFRDASGAFDLFREGIRSLIRGDGNVGISQIGTAFKFISEIIKNNFIIAFNEIQIAIAPAFDFIQKGILYTIELVKLLGSLVGITFGNLGAGVNALSGGGAGSLIGSLTDTIKQAFSPEAIKEGFKFVGLVFAELARSINNIFKSMFDLFTGFITTLYNTLTALLEALNGSVLFGNLTEAIKALKGGIEFTRRQATDADLKRILKEQGLGPGPAADALIDRIRKEGVVDTKASGALGFQMAANSINEVFSTTPEKIDGVLNKFIDNLQSIFSFNLEKTAQENKDALEDRKKEIQFGALGELGAADRIAAANPNNPFVLLGRGIFELNANLRGVLSSATGFLTPQVTPGTDPLTSLQNLFNNARANLQPATVKQQIAELQQQNVLARKQLNNRQREFQQQQGLGIGRLIQDPRRLFQVDKTLQEQRNQFRQFAVTTNQDIQTRNQQIRDLLRRTPQGIQADTIDNIVNAVTGDFQSTRLNKFGFGSTTESQVDLLKDISTKLGTGGSSDSYLKQLVDKAGPLAFTQ